MLIIPTQKQQKCLPDMWPITGNESTNQLLWKPTDHLEINLTRDSSAQISLNMCMVFFTSKVLNGVVEFWRFQSFKASRDLLKKLANSNFNFALVSLQAIVPNDSKNRKQAILSTREESQRTFNH